MKITTLLSLIFSLFLGSAQGQDSMQNIIGIAPFFTTQPDLTNLEFPLSVQNIPGNNSPNLIYEEKMKVNYTGFTIPIYYMAQLPRNFFAISMFGYGVEAYASELNYANYALADPKCIEKETVTSNRFIIYSGFGKTFYVLPTKKLVFIPHLGLFGDIYTYHKKISYYSVGSYGEDETRGSYSISGLSLGLQINYQMSKHFGIGLGWNQLMKLQRKESTYEWYAKTENIRSFTVNLKQSPQLSLLYYFRGKRVNRFIY